MVDDRTIAANLARSQIEDPKGRPFVEPPSYPAIAAPSGYTIELAATTITAGLLQKIDVTVLKGTETVAQVTGYKSLLAATSTPTPAGSPTATPTLTPTPTSTPVGVTGCAFDDFESGVSAAARAGAGCGPAPWIPASP